MTFDKEQITQWCEEGYKYAKSKMPVSFYAINN